MKEPSELERALWEKLKASDDRIRAIDNVPRVSLDFVGAENGRLLVICAKIWSEKYQEAVYVESFYDPELLEWDMAGALAYLGGPMGLVAAFEQKEALRG